MMHNFALGTWFCLLFVSPMLGIRLKPCELAGQLYILDVPKEELAKWLCIADFESRFNTHVVGQSNADGSKDYGLFQISDRYWCAPPSNTSYYAFNGCNVNCNELLIDDITAAVRCAQLIRKQQGWTAWSVFPQFCNGTLVDPDECFQNDQSGRSQSNSTEIPDNATGSTTETSMEENTTIVVKGME
ncbi:lysozyme B [Drosophila sulfurigaster albostrigata]|uniref:lysozyme B n=1 Tax=Drosophila sulfurigaster albostrigata TaxID=89887 RepID=UPI002D21BC1E|nr:lysozyme B [Drosophila sulfurigaster albostrigata]